MKLVLVGDHIGDGLFAEIRIGHYTWADVQYSDKREAYEVRFYEAPEDEAVVLDLGDVYRGLSLAKKALVDAGYPDLPTIDVRPTDD